MINQTQKTLYYLDNLGTEQRRISYQTSTKKKLENGSDDSVLYSKEIFLDDKIRVFEGIKSQITRTTVHNNVSDTALSGIKKLIEQVKSELLKANTSTTTAEGKKAIATILGGVKQNILDLTNTRVNGEYLFAGSDSSIKPFIEDANGNVTYTGDNQLRKILVEEGSYRDKGVNGFDMMMYSSDVATKNNPSLSFKVSDRIIDQDGSEWKLDATKTNIVKYDLDGNITTTTLAVTNNAGTPPTYTANVGTADGTKFEAKTNIFNGLNRIVNALNKVDSAGNPVSDVIANAALNTGITEINNSYDAINVAHAKLGGRNKVFELSQERISAKLNQYNIFSIEVGGADLSKIALESKALELTYTALYSTISKTNQLSLVNFIN